MACVLLIGSTCHNLIELQNNTDLPIPVFFYIYAASYVINLYTAAE